MTQAENGGQPCTGELEETQTCDMGDCEKDEDCVWDDWAAWGACTCSCGGGQKTRNRAIKVSPVGNGQLCEPHSKTEISPCNTQPCNGGGCIDGAWGDWSSWGQCSASCG